VHGTAREVSACAVFVRSERKKDRLSQGRFGERKPSAGAEISRGSMSRDWAQSKGGGAKGKSTRGKNRCSFIRREGGLPSGEETSDATLQRRVHFTQGMPGRKVHWRGGEKRATPTAEKKGPGPKKEIGLRRKRISSPGQVGTGSSKGGGRSKPARRRGSEGIAFLRAKSKCDQPKEGIRREIVRMLATLSVPRKGKGRTQSPLEKTLRLS